MSMTPASSVGDLLPSVDALLQRPALAAAGVTHGRTLLLSAVRAHCPRFANPLLPMNVHRPPAVTKPRARQRNLPLNGSRGVRPRPCDPCSI